MSVSCGSHHTIAVSTNGDVYACGLSTKGRLGLSQDQIKSSLKHDATNIFEMIKVPIISDISGKNEKIKQAYCGLDFTILLNSNGEILTTGNGEFGINCNKNN